MWLLTSIDMKKNNLIVAGIYPDNAQLGNQYLTDYTGSVNYNIFITKGMDSTSGIVYNKIDEKVKTNPKIKSKFSISPNPVKGSFNINMLSKVKALSIEIVDLYGNLKLKSNIKLKKVDISKLGVGVYFVRIFDENGLVEIKKIIKH